MSKEILFLYVAILKIVLILGNTKHVDIREHPYHVSIQKSGKHVCSGAFIHESWIITVASCLYDADLSAISVRVRTSILSSGGDELEISNIFIHEEFDKYVYFNNIAILKLKIPAEFGEKLLPIELPENKDCVPHDGTLCFVTGWQQNLGASRESQLTVTGVPVVNQSTCISSMPTYAPVSKKMVCAGNMSLEVETCQGDPGAPLMQDQTLIGVLSYGLGCKTMIHPGVYTGITSYLPWISASTGIRYP